MPHNLPVTAFAILGLLALDDETLTGYELKQRADSTLRFYWVSPAMSQIYTELGRLTRYGLVRASTEPDGAREVTSYAITEEGREALTGWMGRSAPGFPVLKHSVCLRLLMGDMGDPERIERMLEGYVAECAAARRDLSLVREGLRGRDQPGQDYFHPSLVADWGLDYFADEAEHARRALDRLRNG